MSLVTRTGKGSRLTIAEMDGNLTYLQSNGFVDGEYSKTTREIPAQPGIGEIIDLSRLMVNNVSIPGGVGTYTVSPRTDGAGKGAEFELVIVSKGMDKYQTSGEDGRLSSLAIDYNASSLISGGNGYAVGDTLTIPGSAIGLTGGSRIPLSGSSISDLALTFSVTENSIDTISAIPSRKTYIQVSVSEESKGIYIAVNEEKQENINKYEELSTGTPAFESFIPISSSTPSIHLYQNSNTGGGRADDVPTFGMEEVNIDGNGLAVAVDNSSGIDIGIGSVSTINLYQGSSNSSAAALASNTDGNIELRVSRESNQKGNIVYSGDNQLAAGEIGDQLVAGVEGNGISSLAGDNPASNISMTPDSLTLSNGGLLGKINLDGSSTAGRSTVTLESEAITIDSISLFLPNIPQYSDNLEATNDGYPIGGVYRGPIGDLRIVIPEAPTAAVQ